MKFIGQASNKGRNMISASIYYVLLLILTIAIWLTAYLKMKKYEKIINGKISNGKAKNILMIIIGLITITPRVIMFVTRSNVGLLIITIYMMYIGPLVILIGILCKVYFGAKIKEAKRKIRIIA